MSIREWLNRLKEQNPNLELLQDRLKTFIREKRKDRGFHGPPFGGLFPEREPLEPLNPPPLGIFPPGPPTPDARAANHWGPDDVGRGTPPFPHWSRPPVFPPGPPFYPYPEGLGAESPAHPQLDNSGKGYHRSGSFSGDKEPKRDSRVRNGEQSTVRIRRKKRVNRRQHR